MRQLVNPITVSVRWLLIRLTCDQFLNVLFVNCGIVVHMHRSEFQEHKRSTMLADPSLPKEDRPLRRCLDSGSNRQENWQEKTQRQRASHDIHRPLQNAEYLPALFALR